MKLDPKSLFLADKTRADRHRALVDSRDMHQFLAEAFTVFSLNLPASESPSNGWNSNCRRQGAKEFIETFLNLSTVPKPQTRSTAGELEPEKN